MSVKLQFHRTPLSRRRPLIAGQWKSYFDRWHADNGNAPPVREEGPASDVFSPLFRWPGNVSLLSSYKLHEQALLAQIIQAESRAFSFARPNASNNIPAKMAIMAMTTSNSISVNAVRPNAERVEKRFVRVVFMEPKGFCPAKCVPAIRRDA
jgi:hypothetical protein